MYEALLCPINNFEGHIVRADVYRKSSPPKNGVFSFKSKFHGWIKDKNDNYILTNNFNIGYTEWGDKGPIILLLHGVPSNRRVKLPIQELLSPFCRTIAIDMLGMGGEETSLPQLYGCSENMGVHDGKPDDPSAWDWVYDTEYIMKLMNEKYCDEKFFFQADDWGGGILSHFIDKYPNATCGPIWIDPIAFDGYPVAEIQALGRSSMIPREYMKDKDDN